jgi:YD repeat-containing protein
VEGPDPRFGMTSPLASTLTYRTPGGLTSTVTQSRTVTLSSPGDLLSVVTETDTLNVNGRAYTTTYTAVDKKFTLSSPEGRKRSTSINDKGDLTRVSYPDSPSLSPATFSYDPAGFLSGIVLGDLQQTFSRDTLGRIQSTTNAAGENYLYNHDNANRLTGLTTPLGNAFGFDYDANNNPTAIRMPNGARHGLSFNPLNVLSGYTPPGSPQSYQWTYNLDEELTRTTFPGGRTLDVSYDAGGRPKQYLHQDATVTLRYQDLTDRLFQIERNPSTPLSQQI